MSIAINIVAMKPLVVLSLPSCGDKFAVLFGDLFALFVGAAPLYFFARLSFVTCGCYAGPTSCDMEMSQLEERKTRACATAAVRSDADGEGERRRGVPPACRGAL